jgi:N utilization substance protein B
MSHARTRARECAVQAIYQWQLTGNDLADIEKHFLEEHDLKGVDVAYFRELLHGVPSHLHELDDHITPFLDRSLDSVDPVERAILRVGTYELEFRLETPYRVVINEGVELGKTFGAEDGHKYVNGILDKVAQKLRAKEVKAAAK